MQNSQQEQSNDADAQHLCRHAATQNHVRTDPRGSRDDVTAWRHGGIPSIARTWSLSCDNGTNYCKWQVKLLAPVVSGVSIVKCVRGGDSPLSRDVIPWRHAACVSIYRRIADYVYVCVDRRIADNPLDCDCRLSWLSKWLRLHPTLGLFTRCAAPHNLRGRELAELQQSSFVCTDGKTLDIVGLRGQSGVEVDGDWLSGSLPQHIHNFISR